MKFACSDAFGMIRSKLHIWSRFLRAAVLGDQGEKAKSEKQIQKAKGKKYGRVLFGYLI